jgi:hypothetical protein
MAGAGLGVLSLAACTDQNPATKPTRTTVPLPDADAIRTDYQRMVDFGARLPGHPNHVRFVESLEMDFRAAGLDVGPCESYDYRRWDPLEFGLEVTTASGTVAIPKLSYYVRSAPTPAGGVSGPLYYGGEITATGPTEPRDIPEGSIVVFDGRLPDMSVRWLAAPDFLHLPDEDRDTYLDAPYKRLWLTPPFNLDELLPSGAAGAVIIMDVSSDMIENNFSPHASHYKPPIPALIVGQDPGKALRAQAKQGLQARLTLQAEWVNCKVPIITAVLPGKSDEIIIIDTHTDGQNFIEENGCVAMVQLARHFASLPEDLKLNRTLVFAGWSGHMTGELPECAGWLRAHPDIVARAVTAVTIEHLGAPEWEDIPGKGYAPTGRNEYMNLATTGGALTDIVKAGLQKYDLRQHGIQPAPGKTTGAVFHDSGVPHVGIICGPNYLLGIVPDGHMDKLDAELASRQTHMIAELIKQVDKLPADVLKADDDSLGKSPVQGPDTSVEKQCLP